MAHDHADVAHGPLPHVHVLSISLTRQFTCAKLASWWVIALVTQTLLGATEPAVIAPTYAGPIPAGVMEVPPRREASGLAASRRSPEILWTHDDSEGAPVLYAMDTTGKKRGALRLRGVKNEDWEDMTSFVQGGTAWLLVADTGDNDMKRKTVQIHVVEEPATERLSPERELELPPAYTLHLRYEDGPHDTESVAVDVEARAIYLLTKRDSQPLLFRVPLGPARQDVVVATRVGVVPHLAGSTEMDTMLRFLVGKKASWPTAMNISADNRMAVVLTYGGVSVFVRESGQSWPEALAGIPTPLAFHGLLQAEGACFSTDGRSIYVVSEGMVRLVRYDREDPLPRGESAPAPKIRARE